MYTNVQEKMFVRKRKTIRKNKKLFCLYSEQPANRTILVFFSRLSTKPLIIVGIPHGGLATGENDLPYFLSFSNIPLKKDSLCLFSFCVKFICRYIVYVYGSLSLVVHRLSPCRSCENKRMLTLSNNAVNNTNTFSLRLFVEILSILAVFATIAGAWSVNGYRISELEKRVCDLISVYDSSAMRMSSLDLQQVQYAKELEQISKTLEETRGDVKEIKNNVVDIKIELSKRSAMPSVILADVPEKEPLK